MPVLDYGYAHLTRQPPAARLGKRKRLGRSRFAFQPVYERSALPARAETGSPEEMNTFREKASRLHVVESLCLDAQHLGRFRAREIFTHHGSRPPGPAHRNQKDWESACSLLAHPHPE